MHVHVLVYDGCLRRRSVLGRGRPVAVDRDGWGGRRRRPVAVAEGAPSRTRVVRTGRRTEHGRFGTGGKIAQLLEG